MSKNYKPEEYWTEVGQRIEDRGEENIIAGDDEPFYRYKRREFLKMLHAIDFNGKRVLELGSGPGGNLKSIFENSKPALLAGVDISAQMVKLAKKHNSPEVLVKKINGVEIPFEDRHFDLVFSATVLQHITDENMLHPIIAEMCRVSGDRVFVFERIEKSLKGNELCMGRPVSYYSNIFNANGFQLKRSKFINIQSSYLCCGAIRKLFNPSARKEGEPLTPLAIGLQKATLPLTRVLDKTFPSKRDLGMLEFGRG